MNMKRRQLLLLAATASVAGACSDKGPAAPTDAALSVIPKSDRIKAPPFEMPSLEDNSTLISLASLQPAIIVLNFWASWCAPCRVEAPGLQEVFTRNNKSGVTFLGINFRDDRSKANAFVDAFRITYQNVYDPSGRVAFEYREIVPNPQPGTVIVDLQGLVAAKVIGYVRRDPLQSAIDEISATG